MMIKENSILAPRFRFIRHATLRLEVGGETLLVDPFLSDQGSLASVPFTFPQKRNPLVGLPCSVHEVVQSVTAILVTHRHFDHFADSKPAILPKKVPLFCSAADARWFHKQGFSDVRPIDRELQWHSLRFRRFAAHHAQNILWRWLLGPSSSFAIEADGKTVLLTGDAVLDDRLRATIQVCQPDGILANAGSAQFRWGTPITLTPSDLAEIARLAPSAFLVAAHMDAINHCHTSRSYLRDWLQENSLGTRILVPEDGELIDFRPI